MIVLRVGSLGEDVVTARLDCLVFVLADPPRQNLLEPLVAYRTASRRLLDQGKRKWPGKIAENDFLAAIFPVFQFGALLGGLLKVGQPIVEVIGLLGRFGVQAKNLGQSVDILRAEILLQSLQCLPRFLECFRLCANETLKRRLRRNAKETMPRSKGMRRREVFSELSGTFS